MEEKKERVAIRFGERSRKQLLAIIHFAHATHCP